MTVESTADRAAFVHTDDFGESVTYTPLAGAASTISAVIDRESEDASLGGLGAIQVGYRARVRADDVAAPVEGDTLVTATESFTVQNARQDVSAEMWILDLRKNG